MELTLSFKITLTDGTVIEVEQDLKTVQTLMKSVPKEGYRHGARFYAPEKIHTIEIMPPPEPPKFSDN